MATSREVYNRIRWDARYDAQRFVIGYREGPDGVRELPLPAWDGTVPFHRVKYVARVDGTVVWHRDTGVDLVTSGAALDPAPAPAAPADAFTPLPVSRWAGDAWSVVPDVPRPDERPLRVVVWNVLSPRHGPDEVTALEPRLPALLETLRAQDADVLALVEVTRPFLAALLREPWVRAGYATTDATGDTLRPEGGLLLSRRPLAAVAHEFANNKAALVGRVQAAGRPLAVALVHLTSDQAKDAPRKRAHELSTVVAHLSARAGEEDALLVGDFNARHDDPGELRGLGFVDAWRALRPGEPGYTFDPGRNRIAARTSSRRSPARFDRALLRAATAARLPLELVKVERFGDGPAPASDHEGLALELAAAATFSCAPSPRAALALLPPPRLWAPIDALRRAHDPAAARWMPHVNLLFGFVPPDVAAVHRAAALVTRALAQHGTFGVTLARFAVLEHATSATVYLVPECDPPDALARLHAALAARFPDCVTRGAGSPYTPHLTIGRFDTAPEARAQALALERAWTPLRFDARALSLLTRPEDGPFVVETEVLLGGALERWLAARRQGLPADHARRVRVVERVRAACAAALGPAAVVEVAGSARLGVALGTSDLDLVVQVADRDLATVAAALAGALQADVRVAADARVPRARLAVEGVPVDLFVAPPGDLPRACREVDALRALAHARVPAHHFEVVLRAVRVWAHARRLDAQAWGLLGGAAWAILVVWALEGADPDDPPERLLRRVFDRAAAHPWPAPILLTSDVRWSPRAHEPWHLPIITALPPLENAARAVTPSTRALLEAELTRAATLTAQVLAGGATWDDLAAFPAPLAEHGHVAVLPIPRGDARGPFERDALALVLALERLPGVRRVRPYAAVGDDLVALGLDLTDVATAVPLVEAVLPRVPGAALDRS